MSETIRLCNKCGIPITTENCVNAARYSGGIKPQCLDCDRKYYRERRAKERATDPEAVNQRQLEWQTANPDKRRAIANRYAAGHRTTLHRQRERRLEREPLWTQWYRHVHRAKRKHLPHDLTLEELKFILDHFNGCCAICGKPLNDSNHSFDHWIPLSDPACPGTVRTNILPMCYGKGGCNQLKWRSHPEKWLIKRFGKEFTKRKLDEINQFFEMLRHATIPII